jgi:hypothetical protein
MVILADPATGARAVQCSAAPGWDWLLCGFVFHGGCCSWRLRSAVWGVEVEVGRADRHAGLRWGGSGSEGRARHRGATASCFGWRFNPSIHPFIPLRGVVTELQATGTASMCSVALTRMQCNASKWRRKSARCNEYETNVLQPHRPKQTCANCLSINKICYVATVLLAAHRNLLCRLSGGSNSSMFLG